MVKLLFSREELRVPSLCFPCIVWGVDSGAWAPAAVWPAQGQVGLSPPSFWMSNISVTYDYVHILGKLIIPLNQAELKSPEVQ